MIVIYTGRHTAILQFDQPWDEVLELVFNILALLGKKCQRGRYNIGW